MKRQPITCSMFINWDMYKFVVEEDIPKSIMKSSYDKPEQLLSKQKIYIPIITFNADSSEMGNYVFSMMFPHMI